MKIKRFIARDLPTATRMIKEDFGLAAIILSQRDLPPEEGGGVEITAGVRDADLPPGRTGGEKKAAPEVQPKARTGTAAGLAAYQQAGRKAADFGEVTRHDLDELKGAISSEINELKDLILNLAHRQSLSEKWRGRQDLVNIYRRLMDTGLSAQHARVLVELAAESANAWGGEVEDHIRRAMASKLRLVDLAAKPPKRLALVGPSGVGKTTALVSLATFYRQKGLIPAAITLDTLRLGAAEQLTEYARILGMGVRVCQNRQEFREALELFEGSSDLVLIDTPGRSFQKAEGRQELNSFFNLAQAESLLVLSASMKERDLTAARERGRSFREAGVILTKMDETESLGSLASFIISATPRLAFFSSSPKTSEDFGPATEDKFLDLWLGTEVQGRRNGLDSRAEAV